MDWNGDGTLDVSDAVAMAGFLFGGNPDAPHALASTGDPNACVLLVGCPEVCES